MLLQFALFPLLLSANFAKVIRKQALKPLLCECSLPDVSLLPALAQALQHQLDTRIMPGIGDIRNVSMCDVDDTCMPNYGSDGTREYGYCFQIGYSIPAPPSFLISVKGCFSLEPKPIHGIGIDLRRGVSRLEYGRSDVTSEIFDNFAICDTMMCNLADMRNA